MSFRYLHNSPDTVKTKQDVYCSPIIQFRTRRLYARLVERNKDLYTSGNPFIIDSGCNVVGYFDMPLSFLDEALPIGLLNSYALAKWRCHGISQSIECSKA
jgi:hypothetical protein